MKQKYYSVLAILIICCLVSITCMANAELKSGGFVQVRFSHTENKVSEPNAIIKRAHLRWFGSLDYNWRYFAQIDVADANNDYFRDAIIQWKKYPSFSVNVGHSFIPYSIVNEIPTFKVYLPDAPQPYLALSSTRNTGIRVDGRLLEGLLQYSTGVFNGQRSLAENVNSSDEWIGKAIIAPKVQLFAKSLKLRFIAANHYARMSINDGSKTDRNRYNLAIDLKNAQHRLFAEYFYQKSAPQATSNTRSSGWYATGVLALGKFHQLSLGHSELVLRYEQMDRDHSLNDDNLAALTLGFNVMLDQHIKLQASYRLADDDLGLVKDAALLQIQAVFGI